MHNCNDIVLWLNANFKTGYRKRKIGEKQGDLVNGKTEFFIYVHQL